MARIKAWLLATRHTARDYLDTVVLLERLGDREVENALATFDDLSRQANGSSPLAEVAERLAAAMPADLARLDLKSYRGLIDPWTSWDDVAERGQRLASIVARLVLESGATQ